MDEPTQTTATDEQARLDESRRLDEQQPSSASLGGAEDSEAPHDPLPGVATAETPDDAVIAPHEQPIDESVDTAEVDMAECPPGFEYVDHAFRSRMVTIPY